MEGQGAYLFSQNIMRMIGDPLGVRIEGESKEQLESKVKIINELLNRLAERRKMEERRLAAAQAEGAKVEGGESSTKEDSAKNETTKNEKPKDDTASVFPVKTVPTRIIERLVDGNYRVKGSQPFMIGKREYNVIVTGIVRAEDFAEDGVSSAQLLDPKFDIVSKKKREEL
jgi:flagellar L-ring protein precursor FlgH